MQEAGFDGQTTEELKTLLRNKNTFGVEKLMEQQPVSESLRTLFVSLTSLFGTEEILGRAESLTENEAAKKALQRLREIWRILKIYGVEQYVSFDLGMISGYMYYTGIVFRGYTFGTGDAVIKGGRYDRLLEQFGTPAPAVGFVAVIDQLMNALARQKISQPLPSNHCMIIYENEKLEEAIRRASELRSRGIDVELVRITPERTREDCRAYAKAEDCMLVVEL